MLRLKDTNVSSWVNDKIKYNKKKHKHKTNIVYTNFTDFHVESYYRQLFKKKQLFYTKWL